MENSSAYVRWATQRDMPAVMEIENHSFENPWIIEQFQRHLRRPPGIMLVAEKADRVVGYVLYEINQFGVDIVNIAVHQDYRRQGVATEMIMHLKRKLEPGRRTHILLDVHEAALDAQLFFKAMGFLAVFVIPKFYEDQADAYMFEFGISPRRACEVVR